MHILLTWKFTAKIRGIFAILLGVNNIKKLIMIM